MESALRECGGEPGLKLIETMLWDGASVPRLTLHLDRLNRSAQALGWRQPSAEVSWNCPLDLPQTPARLRLTLDAEGREDWQIAALPAARPQWRIGLAQTRVSSTDPWLGIKSTRRALYDQSRAALPEGLEELIFLNERGEVTEGTITNIFFDRGQGLRTPPLACGLLPGVLRAELNPPEDILLAEDLPKVRLWVGNALRGLIPAIWQA